MAEAVRVGAGVYRVDVMEGGHPGRCAAYVVTGSRGAAVIDPGPTVSIPLVLEALQQIGVTPEAVAYVVATHVHLDHAGGCGAILRRLPNARVLVHPKGARHLKDSSRLVAGARTVFGDRLERLFGEVVPVPEERILEVEDGHRIPLDGERRLECYHTPGHARHHMVLFDPSTGGLFSGDAAGVCMESVNRRLGAAYALPATAPPDFDPAAMVASLQRIAGLHPELIYYSHFGAAGPAEGLLRQVADEVQGMVAVGRRALAELGWSAPAPPTPGAPASPSPYPEALVQAVQERLRSFYGEWMGRVSGRLIGPADLEPLELDIELNAKGLVHYLLNPPAGSTPARPDPRQGRALGEGNSGPVKTP